MPQSKSNRVLNPCGAEVRSASWGHPAGGRAGYHHLGVFWWQNPVLELIALSGRSFSRQNALAISKRQLKYATGWPVSCIIQVVAWGVAFLGPGPATRDPPGQPPGTHQASQQAAIWRHQPGSRVGRKFLVSHLEFVCLVLRGGSGGSTTLIAQEQRPQKNH